MDQTKSNRTVYRDASPKRDIFVDHLVDVRDAPAFSTSTAIITLLNGLTVGSEHYQRIGRQVRIKRIKLSAQIGTNPDDTTFTSQQAWRIMLLLDRQANGAAPAITDIIGGISNAGTNLYNSGYGGLMPINPLNLNRFHVLADYVKQASSLVTQTQPALQIYMWVDIDVSVNILTKYNAGNAGTVADILQNSIYVVAIRTNTDDNNDFFRYWARVYFEP